MAINLEAVKAFIEDGVLTLNLRNDLPLDFFWGARNPCNTFATTDLLDIGFIGLFS